MQVISGAAPVLVCRDTVGMIAELVRHLLPLLQMLQRIQISDGLKDMAKLLNHEIGVKLSLAFVLGSNIGSY